MLDAGGILGYCSKLPSRPGVGNFGEGKSKGFVFRESCEVAAFQEVAEMSHCQVKGEELTVEGTILPLSRSELSAEEGQWLP